MKLLLVCLIYFIVSIVNHVLSFNIRDSVIDDEILQSLTEESHSIILSFQSTKETLETINHKSFLSHEEKSTAVYDILTRHAQITQNEVITLLNILNIKFISLWITNQIHIPFASSQLITQLSTNSQIISIKREIRSKSNYENSKYNQKTQFPGNEEGKNQNSHFAQSHKNLINETQWGVKAIEAPEACSLGYCGQGIRVAIIATGIRGTHEAYTNKRHSGYSWFDPIDHTEIPSENKYFYGTVAAGIVLGDYGIGVAPNATWIACRACYHYNNCSQVALTLCAQFVLCPNNPEETHVDCSQTAHVVSNPWEFDSDDDGAWFKPVIDAWKFAGVIPVFMGGYNREGRGCSVHIRKPWDDVDVIAVGAYLNNETGNYMTIYSPQGPTNDGEIKPDFIAPGMRITSSDTPADDAYAYSFHSPIFSHTFVTGAIAILLSKNPKANYTTIYEALKIGAYKDIIPTNDNCGNVPDSSYPNNNAGYGRISTLASLKFV